MKRNQSITKACQAIAAVKSEVDKLSVQVSAIEAAVNGATKVADNNFIVVTEMLMIQLLKLDSIEAEGEAKVHRRVEVSIARFLIYSGNYELFLRLCALVNQCMACTYFLYILEFRRLRPYVQHSTKAS